MLTKKSFNKSRVEVMLFSGICMITNISEQMRTLKIILNLFLRAGYITPLENNSSLNGITKRCKTPIFLKSLIDALYAVTLSIFNSESNSFVKLGDRIATIKNTIKPKTKPLIMTCPVISLIPKATKFTLYLYFRNPKIEIRVASE